LLITKYGCDWCGEPATYKQEIKPVSEMYSYACDKHRDLLANSVKQERVIKIGKKVQKFKGVKKEELNGTKRP
jgi:hypothetical protein